MKTLFFVLVALTVVVFIALVCFASLGICYGDARCGNLSTLAFLITMILGIASGLIGTFAVRWGK